MNKNTEENILAFNLLIFQKNLYLGSQIMYSLNNVSLLAQALTFRVNSKWNISIFSRESHCRRADLERGLLNFHHSSAIPSQTQLVESLSEFIYRFFFKISFDSFDKIANISWKRWILNFQIKFIYSKKATKFCEISTLLSTGTTQD